MRGLGRTLAVLAFLALPAVAAAKGPRANPVVWNPPDATAGEPIDVVFDLSVVGSGVREDVAVVLHGRAGAERFPAIPLGSGRYEVALTFPYGGEWNVLVAYGRDAAIPLGKGGIRMPGPPPAENERAAPATRPAPLVGGLLLVLALSGVAVAAFRSVSRGNRALPG